MSKYNMLRCTYIVLIHNDEDNILNLVDSVKKIKGNFRKEFIFVDDGSTDESLKVLKIAVNDLPRTTIITQSNQGSSLSINKALNLVTGDYIHFVEGGEILHPDSTSALLEACLSSEACVAIGSISQEPLKDGGIDNNYFLISKPVESILLGRSPNIGTVGMAGSFVSRDLLDKVGRADCSVYSQSMSLSLRCARNSKFVYVPEDISYILPNKASEDAKFLAYNNLKSVYNFAKFNEEFISKFIPQLFKFLAAQTSSTKEKFTYSMKSITSKYLKSSSLEKVLELYKREIDKLF